MKENNKIVKRLYLTRYSIDYIKDFTERNNAISRENQAVNEIIIEHNNLLEKET